MKSREQLLFSLNDVIKKFNYNIDDKKKIRSIGIKFMQKGFSPDRIKQIISGSFPISGLDDDELCMLTVALYDEFKNSSIKPEDYFSKSEIDTLKDFVKLDEEVNSFKLKAIKSENKEEYIGYISLYDIKKYFSNAILSYFYTTQRQAKYKTNAAGNVMVMPNLNEKSVKEISDLMYDNNFESNTITLNVRRIEGKQQNIKYDNDKMELEVVVDYDETSDKETWLDCIDGWHRTNSAVWAVDRAIKTNKTLTDELIVVVKNLNSSEARSFIAREDKRNKLDKNYAKSLDIRDLYISVAKGINDYGLDTDNVLKNKIGETEKEVKFLDKYTTYNDIVEGLKLTEFDFRNSYYRKENIRIIVENISDFLNYVIGKKYGDNVERVKEETIFLHPKMFIAYISMCSVLNDKKIDKNIIEKMFDYIQNNKDFIINEFGLNNKKIKNNMLYNHFNKLTNRFCGFGIL